jgi:hypothetical protein
MSAAAFYGKVLALCHCHLVESLNVKGYLCITACKVVYEGVPEQVTSLGLLIYHKIILSNLRFFPVLSPFRHPETIEFIIEMAGCTVVLATGDYPIPQTEFTR